MSSCMGARSEIERSVLMGRLRPLRCGFVVATMPAVLSMHEYVKKRTGEDQQPRQPAQKVRAVFRNEIEGRDRQERVEDDVGGREPAPAIVILVKGMLVLFHGVSSSRWRSRTVRRKASTV